jgi:hypothetical protein
MRDTNIRQSLPAAIALAAAVAVTVLGGTAEAQQVAVTSSINANVYTPGVGGNPGPNVWVTLPGAVVNIVVPPFQQRLLLATFSAESACFQSAAAVPSWCPVRILFNGVPGAPNAGVDFAFDSNPSGNAIATALESHSMQRYKTFAAGEQPLNVNVIVQRTTTDMNTSFSLDDWTLSVLALNP